MLPKRTGRSDESGVFEANGADQTPVTAEALRAGAEAGKAAAPAKHEEGISLFWRVFGGTILSIAALVAVTLYNSLTGSISELRSELHKLAEARADMIRKDEFNTRMSSNWDRVQGLQAQNTSQNATLTSHRTELDGLKERVGRQAAEIDAARKESTAALDGVKKDLAAVEALKERVGVLVADAKAHRDDYQKLRQDVDKNHAADQERKARRDEQHKELEKAIKELQAAVLDCQVKLARLEGQATTAKPASNPKPAARPRPAEPDKAGPPRPDDE